MNERVYIHERIPIEGGARGRMIEMIRTRWAPHLARRYGVRLLGVWAEVGSTAAWPQVRVHWEMDDWNHFARAQGSQYPMEERDVFLTEIWNQAPVEFEYDDDCAVCFMLEGEIELEENGETYKFEPGDVVYVPQQAGLSVNWHTPSYGKFAFVTYPHWR